MCLLTGAGATEAELHVGDVDHIRLGNWDGVGDGNSIASANNGCNSAENESELHFSELKAG